MSLSVSDGRNNNNMGVFRLDGTYRITITNLYGRKFMVEMTCIDDFFQFRQHC